MVFTQDGIFGSSMPGIQAAPNMGRIDVVKVTSTVTVRPLSRVGIVHSNGAHSRAPRFSLHLHPRTTVSIRIHPHRQSNNQPFRRLTRTQNLVTVRQLPSGGALLLLL